MRVPPKGSRKPSEVDAVLHEGSLPVVFTQAVSRNLLYIGTLSSAGIFAVASYICLGRLDVVHSLGVQGPVERRK